MCLNLIGNEIDFIFSEDKIKSIRFKLQSKLILNEIFIVDPTNRQRVLGFTEFGRNLHANLEDIAKHYVKDERFSIEEKQKVPYHGLTDCYKNKMRFLEGDTYINSDIVKMFDHYCITQKPNPLDPLPEEIFPINKELENIFNKQQLDVIYDLCDCHTCHIDDKDHSQPEEKDEITEEDINIINRVLNTKSHDKAILFIGFNQTTEEEGYEILFNTPGYERSIFWGKWGDRPDANHNTIKCCFSKTQELLNKKQELYNFFDYIIIGMQTDNYIPLNVWTLLGHMLKEGGRLVCSGDDTCTSKHYWINKILNKSYLNNNFFDFYRCDNDNEKVFNEIHSLVSFDEKPNEECYATTNVLCWHKKNMTQTF